MKCPYCLKGKTDVINSRKVGHGAEVWRRRECPSCKEVFTTSELFSHTSLMIVKRNLTRQRFVYEKMYASLLNAIGSGKGRDQGDDATLAKKLAHEVLEKMMGLKSKYVSTKDIIHFAHGILHKEDPFFALRYIMYSPYRLKVMKVK